MVLNISKTFLSNPVWWRTSWQEFILSEKYLPHAWFYFHFSFRACTYLGTYLSNTKTISTERRVPVSLSALTVLEISRALCILLRMFESSGSVPSRHAVPTSCRTTVFCRQHGPTFRNAELDVDKCFKIEMHSKINFRECNKGDPKPSYTFQNLNRFGQSFFRTISLDSVA